MYSPGLQWFYYSSNSNFKTSCSSSDPASCDSTYTVTQFDTTAPSASGTISTIYFPGSWSGDFSNFATTTMALQFKGYFLPDITGEWTFWQSNYYNNNDDMTALYIGNTAMTPTTSNIDKYVQYKHSRGQSAYRVTLTAGIYYPITLYYGQDTGGFKVGLGYTSPADTTNNINYDGTGKFFNLNDNAYQYSLPAVIGILLLLLLLLLFLLLITLLMLLCFYYYY